MTTAPRPPGILHVVDSLAFGGLERVVTDLAIAQHRRGHPVVVFSLGETAGFRAELQATGVPVVVGAKSRPFDLNLLRALRQTVADHRIDRVHAHNYVPNYHAATALLGLSRSPVQVCTCHDMGMRLTGRKLRWMYRLSLLRTARIALVSAPVRDHHIASGWVSAARSEVVMNGLPVDRFEPTAARRAAARASLGIGDSAPVIGCVGRLVELKNQQLLVETMPPLLAIHPDLVLVLVGDGDRAAGLRERAAALGVAHAVRFLGSRPMVHDLLCGFDLFALPSFTEGLSVALLEACAAGLPIIASDVDGNRAVIRHATTGLLIPVDDRAAWLAAIGALLRDPAQRAQLGARARQWAIAHAGIDTMYCAYEAFYRRAR